jgi:hypothetical protein
MSAGKSIPDENTIKEAAEIEIFNAKGAAVKFGSLFEKQKTVVVFIREHLDSSRTTFINLSNTGHFFCGVRTLSF